LYRTILIIELLRLSFSGLSFTENRNKNTSEIRCAGDRRSVSEHVTADKIDTPNRNRFQQT